MLLEPLCISIVLFENMNFHPLCSRSILLKAILFMFVMIWIVNKPSFRYSWFSFSCFDKIPLSPPQVLFLKISKISQVFGNYFFESNFSNFLVSKMQKKVKVTSFDSNVTYSSYSLLSVFFGSPWSWRELKLVLIHIITIQKLFLYSVPEHSMNTYAVGLDVCQCYGHQTWKWMWPYKVHAVDQKHFKMDKF
jgi:hypothetical protein